MLNHEQPQEQSQQSAALVRVTPEELAAAIARLEARRAGADGKIAIGDAVTELSLDATPEEVLAEVQAGQKQAQAVKPRRPLSLGQRLRLYFVAAILTLGMTALWAQGTVVTPADMAVTAISPAVTYSPPPQRLSLTPNLLVGDRAGKMVLLSEVGDNQPVHCSYGNGSFQQYSPGENTQWTLIKHGGQTYVRGWILKMSPGVLAQDGADVSTVRDNNFAVPITLPVNGFTVGNSTLPYYSPDAVFHAQNIHLDGHAYEKW